GCAPALPQRIYQRLELANAHLRVSQLDPGSSSVERHSQTILLHGLQEIVDASGREGLHREMIEGRDEHDLRHFLIAQGIDELKPVELRHLDVEQHNIRGHGTDQFERASAIARLTHEFDFRQIPQTPLEALQRERLVIDREYPHVHAHAAISRGRLSSTVKLPMRSITASPLSAP